MDSPFSPAIFLYIISVSFFFLLVSSSPNSSLGLDAISNGEAGQRDERTIVGSGIIGRRHLMSFKETPIGTNITYDCSPSGPCVPCSYSEKVFSHFLHIHIDHYFSFDFSACLYFQLAEGCLFCLVM